MTLGEELDTRLRPGSTQASSGPASAEADVEDADRLGVSLRRLKVAGGRGGLPGAVERLPGAASRALGETIVPVEVDAGLGGAVFRTAPNEVREREFYEIRATGTEATVERFRAHDTGRDKVPFTLTRKQLGRLVDALDEAQR